MPSDKHGGGNVMVWGCFGAGKVGDLYMVKGILNKEGYHSILQRHAIFCGQRLIELISSFNRTMTQSTPPNYARMIWGRSSQLVFCL